MAVLTQDELIEAVKEWAERRGLPPADDIEFFVQHQKGPQSTLPSNREGNYTFHVQIRGLKMEKQGPYR